VETCRHSTALQRPHATPPFFLLLQHEDAGCVAEHWRVAAGDGGGRRRRERESRSRERPARRHQRQPRGVLDPPRACRPGGSCFRWDEPSADTKFLCTTRAQGSGFQKRQLRAAERRHCTGGGRTGSPTLQTLQYPILRLPWVCFRGGTRGRRCAVQARRGRLRRDTGGGAAAHQGVVPPRDGARGNW
jgi:hypothetical protein